MKVLQRIKNDKAHATVRGWSIKLLSTVIVGCMATSAGHTSDREIYQASSNGNASIMMMLDNSISMGHSTGYDSIKDDYNIDPRAVRTCIFIFICSTDILPTIEWSHSDCTMTKGWILDRLAIEFIIVLKMANHTMIACRV